MTKNPWLKLAAVSFAGIIISFVILWSASQFLGYTNTQGYSYQYGVQNSMNFNNNMSMQSNMNSQSSSSSGMGMMDDKMQGNMNSSQSSMMMDMGM
jgi:hypothetical protein